MYLTVKEIAEKLGSNGITSNQEVIRRWIRQGKFESSIKLSNKQGWLVDSAEIERLIADNQQTSDHKKELEQAYKQGFSDGKQAERQAYHAKIRDILHFGYEKRGNIIRSEFMQLLYLPTDKFKKFCDKHAFSRGVAKPRRALEYLEADGIYYFINVCIIDSWEDEYQEVIDNAMAQEENARRILERKLYLDYLAENSSHKK